MRNGQVLSVLLVAVLSAAAQEARHGPPPPSAPAASSNGKAPEQTGAEEKPSVTHHRITVRGQTLEYTATAALMPIKDAQGKTEAHMFYVAYTLDNGGAHRPLTFAFNGGPGAATIWLHMGAFGPKRVKLLPNGFMPHPPFELEDNPNTLLDKTDLVFVDAIGTGYSRPVSPEAGKKFWSLHGDIEAFGDFIRLYLENNSRWNSPLYLAGESYGTTRAAGLSGYLIDHGIALNGIVLISTVLNFQTIAFAPGNDLPYILYIPTYAMIAAYHHKLAPELQDRPDALREEVQKWASTEYAVALEKGDAISDAEKKSVIDHLARYTGLPKQYIERCNLRVDLEHFDAELLRDEGKVAGRLDGRFTAPEEPRVEESPEFDPSEASLRPPYTSVFGDYVRQDLGYKTDEPYHVLGGGIGHWDFQVTGWSGFPDTSHDLVHAFEKNPYMHVFVAEGMYDAATPYFAIEYTLTHMGVPSEDHKNISRDQFESGHMIYIDNASLTKLRKDIDGFIDSSLR